MKHDILYEINVKGTKINVKRREKVGFYQAYLWCGEV